MILCLPAPNIYEAQDRVAGHKHTPTSRESLKRLRDLVPRLRELGVTKVISSDLDAQSGEYLAHKLNVPAEEWESLRRFNWGKLHGTETKKAHGFRGPITGVVPVKGGDSWVSFDKRLAHSKQRLVDVGNALVILNQEVFGKMFGIPEGTIIAPFRLYEIELGKAHGS